MKIIFSGGGTGGSVSPLIALFEEIKKQQPQTEFFWLATRNGPELKLIANYQIPVKSIFAGKLRRYFSLKNFFDLALIKLGFIQSFFIILKFQPDVIISAGGFVSVPVVWAGWLLRKKIIIHQQDVRPGLANKLMAPFAKIITVTFKKSLADFPAAKTILTGNPVRADILAGNRQTGQQIFKLKSDLPTVLIIGGGTGASNLNKLTIAALPQLTASCQVIHLTGGKVNQKIQSANYYPFDFLIDDLKHAFAAADLVVSRAGLATLSELAVLAKPVIIIPIPHSHQQDNALEFAKNKAALVLMEPSLTPQKFGQVILLALNDKILLNNLSHSISQLIPANAAEKIAELILK